MNNAVLSTPTHACPCGARGVLAPGDQPTPLPSLVESPRYVLCVLKKPVTHVTRDLVGAEALFIAPGTRSRIKQPHHMI